MYIHLRISSAERMRSSRPDAEAVKTPSITADQTPLQIAQSALEAGNLDEAEKAFLNVIRTKPHSEESYRGLTDIYIQKKDFAFAYETLLYLWKLMQAGGGSERVSSSAQTAYDLWDVCFKLEKNEEAQKWMRQALSQEPNNPKFLDAALETYISLGYRLHAERVFEKLKAANPDNNKLSEFSERIAGLSY